jgi:hypothetical protein
MNFATPTTEDRELEMATQLSQAIQTGAIRCWKANGDPIRAAVPLENLRNTVPYLTAAAGNAWLKSEGYLQEWVPAAKRQPQTGKTKRWTESEVKRLSEYRKTHTEPETAAYFGVSGPRVRYILAGYRAQIDKEQSNPFKGLGKR